MHDVEAKGILSSLNGMNIYRGCTHGCIYCDSRSKCYGFTHEFEDIEVKKNAPELLERVRTTAPLFELAPQERRNELAGCFALGRSAQRLVVGKRVLLCDDIYTTGSTMAEAARVLLQAGARQVCGVALCAASHNW